MRIWLLSLFASAALALAFPALAEKPDVLEVIAIQGEINDGTAEAITREVEKINESPRSKAVLLTLDTPGGGAIASAVIYEELAKLKVPVVVWCQNLCASGGVYVAMAQTVKYIGVRTETIGGSVGVRSQIIRYNRLLDYLKVDMETYKSGVLKDAGNPTRAASDPEKQYLQGIVDALALRFYAVVQKARGPKIGPAKWSDIKTARIFIGDEIVAAGLADAVMTRAQAVAKAKELSGSKTIFTRDELKKMSSQADSFNHDFAAPAIPLRSQFGDVAFLIELLKEVRTGSSMKVEYRMPYTF
jgi:signal peptide peptidase SppA